MEEFKPAVCWKETTRAVGWRGRCRRGWMEWSWRASREGEISVYSEETWFIPEEECRRGKNPGEMWLSSSEACVSALSPCG